MGVKVKALAKMIDWLKPRRTAAKAAAAKAVDAPSFNVSYRGGEDGVSSQLIIYIESGEMSGCSILLGAVDSRKTRANKFSVDIRYATDAQKRIPEHEIARIIESILAILGGSSMEELL
jgi:hypothetical protein